MQTTMSQKNNSKNKNSSNKREQHQQLTTVLSNCDSDKGNETTKFFNSESEESEGEAMATVVKNLRDGEGGSKGIVGSTNWKNNKSLRSGCQITRHLMSKIVNTHVFKENKAFALMMLPFFLLRSRPANLTSSGNH